MSDAAPAGWPGRVAVGILRTDPPQVFLAESPEVLSRVLALEVVAQAKPDELRNHPGLLEKIREALLEERWADAVVGWIDATGDAVDAYPDEPVWSESRLDLEKATLEIRVAPIFDDSNHDPDGPDSGA
ncbi:MAG: hypothetical protein QOK47_1076 [Actinomycetota bacterium]|jgi:hypothetical protein|nr:hypothetical protein [Actinomycetota bacterium]